MEAQASYHTAYSPNEVPDWDQHNKGVTPIFFTETIPLFGTPPKADRDGKIDLSSYSTSSKDHKAPRIGADGKPLATEMEFVRIVVAGDGLCEAVTSRTPSSMMARTTLTNRDSRTLTLDGRKAGPRVVRRSKAGRR
jgi:hypothetical protein